MRVFQLHLGSDALANVGDVRSSQFFFLSQVYIGKPDTRVKMNSLSFDDPSLDNLDPTLTLHDPSDIDTALLSDIDGKDI